LPAIVFLEQLFLNLLPTTFAEMGNLDVSLAKQLVQLLKTTDADFAREIQAQDARVDELHRHVFDVVLG
jgi:phosphate transport system protein